MGKKKDDSSAGVACILVVILIAVILWLLMVAVQIALLVVPVALLIAAIVHVYKYKKNYKPYAADGFWLNDTEKLLFCQFHNRLSVAQGNKQAVADEVRRAGVHINQNGRISARSYRGKALRDSLDAANASIEEAEPYYNYLSELPRIRWKKARKHFTLGNGFTLALVAYVVTLLFTADNIGYNYSNYVHYIGRSADSTKMVSADSIQSLVMRTDSVDNADDAKETLVDPDYENAGDFTGVLLDSLVKSLITFAVVWLICIIIFFGKYEEPPFVDINNLSSFPKK